MKNELINYYKKYLDYLDEWNEGKISSGDPPPFNGKYYYASFENFIDWLENMPEII